jgi:hypothetical protein
MRFDGRLALPVLGPIHAVGHWAITGVQARRGLEPKWPNPAVVACTAQATRPVSRFILRIPPEALLPPLRQSLPQCPWPHHRCVAAPAQRPSLRLLDAVQPRPQSGLSARQLRQLLARMPPPASDQVRRPPLEINHHLVIVSSLEHAQTPAQILVRVELPRIVNCSAVIPGLLSRVRTNVRMSCFFKSNANR